MRKLWQSLPALILCATSLYGIKQGLVSLTTTLNTPTSKFERKKVSKTKTYKKIRLMDLLPRPNYKTEIQNYQHLKSHNETNPYENFNKGLEDLTSIIWSSPKTRQPGIFVKDPNFNDNTPEFEKDCTSQCLYFESQDSEGFIRYQVNAGEIFKLRVNTYSYQPQYCSSEPYCNWGEFTMDGTILVMDKDGDFSRFNKTTTNLSKKPLWKYYNIKPKK
jgi:hypothetical protein